MDHELREPLLRERSSRPKSMAAVERLALSPYEKWSVHRRFPFKLALHVLLLALTSVQLGVFGEQNAAYMRATHRNWAYFFLPPARDIGVVPRYQRELFTLNETLAALAFMRDAYFAIGDASVANYDYVRDSSGTVLPLEVEVTRLLPSDALDVRVYNVTADPSRPIGPFDPSLALWQQKRLLRSLRLVRFAFFLQDSQDGTYYRECFRWHVHVSFTMQQSAQLRAEVDESHVARCRSWSLWSALRERFVWLHVVVALVAAVYLALSLKALRRSVGMISRAETLLDAHREAAHVDATIDTTTRGRGVRHQRDRLEREAFGAWSTLPFALKLKLFNSLQLVVSVALVLLLVSSAWSLALLKAHVPLHFWHRLLHASALLLLWSCLVGYLEHNRHVYSIVLTLKWGAPRVFQFLVGVSPIFLGYALFGTIYFGTRLKAFGSVGASAATLFAVMNGDEILDTFDALELHHFRVSGKLFLYSFIALFIYVVLNIFVAIVEEAFFATRARRRLLSSLLTDPTFTTAQAAHETEISAEVVRVLLRAVDDSSDASRRERPRE